MIPIGHADGHGTSTAKERNNTPPKRMSVGVKKPRLPCTMRDAEKPVATGSSGALVPTNALGYDRRHLVGEERLTPMPFSLLGN